MTHTLNSTDTAIKQFSTWDEFVAWKESEEKSSHSCFVLPKGEEVSHDLDTSK